MSTWLARATRNLLAHSRAKAFTEAKREWTMTNGYRDLGTPSADCELCEHPRIRHTFEIANGTTGAHLWIGSECITKFVPVYEAGVEITGKAKSTYIARKTGELINEARRLRAFSLLDRLARTDARFRQRDWKDSWELGYSVKQVLMLSAIAAMRDLPFDAEAFRINTRRGRVIDQLDGITSWQYQRIRGALTPKRQQEFDSQFGVTGAPF